MNKQDLIAKIAQDTGISKTNATAAVESFFDGITRSLKKGQPITFGPDAKWSVTHPEGSFGLQVREGGTPIVHDAPTASVLGQLLVWMNSSTELCEAVVTEFTGNG